MAKAALPRHPTTSPRAAWLSAWSSANAASHRPPPRSTLPEPLSKPRPWKVTGQYPSDGELPHDDVGRHPCEVAGDSIQFPLAFLGLRHEAFHIFQVSVEQVDFLPVDPHPMLHHSSGTPSPLERRRFPGSRAPGCRLGLAPPRSTARNPSLNPTLPPLARELHRERQPASRRATAATTASHTPGPDQRAASRRQSFAAEAAPALRPPRTPSLQVTRSAGRRAHHQTLSFEHCPAGGQERRTRAISCLITVDTLPRLRRKPTCAWPPRRRRRHPEPHTQGQT